MLTIIAIVVAFIIYFSYTNKERKGSPKDIFNIYEIYLSYESVLCRSAFYYILYCR